jgi:hypothetical protein
MMAISDLFRLIPEFRDLARDYLLQETVEPAKKLGRFAGFSLGAGIAWAMAVVLLSVAGMRAMVDLMPDGAYWEALGYAVFSFVLLVFAGIVIQFVPKQKTGGGDGS